MEEIEKDFELSVINVVKEFKEFPGLNTMEKAYMLHLIELSDNDRQISYVDLAAIKTIYPRFALAKLLRKKYLLPIDGGYKIQNPYGRKFKKQKIVIKKPE